MLSFQNPVPIRLLYTCMAHRLLTEFGVILMEKVFISNNTLHSYVVLPGSATITVGWTQWHTDDACLYCGLCAILGNADILSMLSGTDWPQLIRMR